MSETPHRVQLSRQKGWRMPENTVKVSRPSKWGNPFPLSGFSREIAVSNFRALAESTASLDPSYYAPLRGKNLACFCRLDQECHADVLLELANAAAIRQSKEPE